MRGPAQPDKPYMRTSFRAVAPNGSLVAQIPRAMEHSMGNPTVGSLLVSNGLELPKCNPAFLWSDDSRYLAVPQWKSSFLSSWRQCLVIVDVEQRTLYTSPIMGWLLLPRTFEQGKLKVQVSHRAGLAFGWRKRPLIFEVPRDLQAFKIETYAAGAALPSNDPTMEN